jgi:hypothetical protein
VRAARPQKVVDGAVRRDKRFANHILDPTPHLFNC